ncbi:extracellular solute-binding protein [Kribbella sp. NPDC051137]|uniref:ABC transporter substrate-binding protein n=1 Tax=Kribbella sp. NPDC051137 TaxID=3155045 RepID=UPI0034326A16
MKSPIAGRITATCTAAALAATALAGCGSGSGAGSSAGKELTYWSMWKDGEPQQTALKASIAEFTQQTGIKVNVQWQGRDVLTKLQPTLMNSPAADLIDNPYNNVKSKIPAGGAEDLGGVLGQKVSGEDKTVGEVIPEDLQKLAAVDGKHPMLPYVITCNSIWYNGARFPQLAKNPPATWQAFQQLVGKQKLALDADIPGYNASWYISLVIAKLGVGSFHQAAADKTGATWDKPQYAAAAAQVEQLAKGRYFADGYNASKFPAMQQKWATNNADFILMGSWLPSEAKTYAAEGFQYRTFNFPADGSPSTPVACQPSGWVVPAKAEHKPAAEQLIAFLYGKKQMQSYEDATASLMARQDVSVAPAAADIAALVKKNGTYMNADGVTADFSDWWTKVFLPLDDQLVTGKLSAADFIGKLKSQSADYWKRGQ